MKILLSIIAFIIIPSLSLADEVIKGHYCYTYGDNESLKEARELTKTLAIEETTEMIVGQITTLTYHMPSGATSYRVWLPK